jgi:hypothetical protein
MAWNYGLFSVNLTNLGLYSPLVKSISNFLPLAIFSYLFFRIHPSSPLSSTTFPYLAIPSSLHWTFRLFLMSFVLHRRIVHRDASLSRKMGKKSPVDHLYINAGEKNRSPSTKLNSKVSSLKRVQQPWSLLFHFLRWGSLFLVDENFKIAVSLLGHRSYLFLGTIVSELGSSSMLSIRVKSIALLAVRNDILVSHTFECPPLSCLTFWVAISWCFNWWLRISKQLRLVFWITASKKRKHGYLIAGWAKVGRLGLPREEKIRWFWPFATICRTGRTCMWGN